MRQRKQTRSETWRNVFYNCYAVSNRGRVKRIKPGQGTWAGRILTPYNNGYVKLHYNNKMKQIKIEEL